MKQWKSGRRRMVAIALAVILAGTAVDLSTLTVSAAEETQTETATSGSCGAEGDNVTWTFDSETGILTIRGNGAMADYENYNDKPWYSVRDDINMVKIVNGVTSIGKRAFDQCREFTSIEIPKGVTSIGDSAFGDCDGLTSVTLPEGVTGIGALAFFGCNGLTSVTLPESLTGIGRYAFHGCDGLTSITLPEGLNSIGEEAFSACDGLTSITLHCGRREEINSGSFYGIDIGKLKTVNYSHTMGGYSAGGNKLHDSCLNGCTLEEPVAATLSIDEEADLFYTGSAVKPAMIMTYPDNWAGDKIQPTAGNCTYSNNINPGTATCTFTYAEGVAVSVDFTIEKAIPTFNAADIPAISGTYGENLSEMGLSKTSDTSANNIAGTWSITEENAESIYPVVGGDTAYEIAFTPNDTMNYETVTKTITANVAKATPYIETAPSAADITYGATLGSSGLSNGVVHYGKTDNTVVAGSFTWKDGNIKPAVSDSNSTTYTVVFTPADTTNYNTVETKISLTVNKAENAPNMPGNTMNVPYSNKTVSDITLPEGWAWQDVDKETALEVGVSVKATAVYTGTDKGNYKNETAEITITRSPGAPAKGTKVTDDSGKATYKVTKSDLKNGTVTYVAPTNKKATSVSIPATVIIGGVKFKVTAIEKNAFKKNKNIKSVTIGKNVKTIGANAFYNCTKLKTVKIGKNVTKISAKAFYGCSKLKTLTIKSTKLTTKKIGSKAFGKTPKSMTVKIPKKKFSSYKTMLIKRGVNKKAKFKKN